MGKTGLPPNWKKAKDKDGSVYFFNSLTKERRADEPRPIPTGWEEKLHADNGRVIYYHKKTRHTQYTFPTAEDVAEAAGEGAAAAGPAEPSGGKAGGGIFKSFFRGSRASNPRSSSAGSDPRASRASSTGASAAHPKSRVYQSSRDDSGRDSGREIERESREGSGGKQKTREKTTGGGQTKEIFISCRSAPRRRRGVAPRRASPVPLPPCPPLTSAHTSPRPAPACSPPASLVPLAYRRADRTPPPPGRSTLIREVKLCVGPDSHPDSKELHKQLDSIYERLHSKDPELKIKSTVAIAEITRLVGSTIVQQAGHALGPRPCTCG